MDLVQRALCLGRIEAFAAVPPGAVVALAGRARPRTLTVGEPLSLSAEELACVAEGELVALPRTLGAVIGLIDALAGTPTARTIDVVQAGAALVLHRDDVLGVLREHGPAMQAALALLVARLRSAP